MLVLGANLVDCTCRLRMYFVVYTCPRTSQLCKLYLQVENVFCRLYLPENITSRHVIIAMSENMKIVDRDGNILEKPFCYDITKQWRRLTERRYIDQ